jgi:uncharacterized protein (DUF2062 family)
MARPYTTTEAPGAMPGDVIESKAVVLSPEKAARLRAVWKKLGETLAGDARPAGLAMAVALGIFVGCTPFYGIQTVLVFAFAALFRLNPFLAFLGSQVSIGPVGLGIAGIEVALGEWLRYGRWAMPKAATGLGLAKWLWGHALYSWALGSAVLGVSLAAAGGLAAWAAVTALRSRAPRAV